MAQWLVPLRWERRPPRKVRTAYAYFVKDNYRRFRQQLGTRMPQAIIRSLGQAWRNMGPQERVAYRTQELNDRRRYEEAKVNWARHFRGRIPRMRRRRKPRDAPVRTRNPFIMFEREVWGDIKGEHPDWPQQEIVQECGRRWRALPEDQKLRYKLQADQDKARYSDEIAEYRRQRAQLEADRRVRNFEARLVALRQRNEIIRAEQKEKLALAQAAGGGAVR